MIGHNIHFKGVVRKISLKLSLLLLLIWYLEIANNGPFMVNRGSNINILPHMSMGLKGKSSVLLRYILSFNM